MVIALSSKSCLWDMMKYRVLIGVPQWLSEPGFQLQLLVQKSTSILSVSEKYTPCRIEQFSQC